MRDFSHIPVIDISDLTPGAPGQRSTAAAIGRACRESGFFYIAGHGVEEALQTRLASLSREFFAQDLESKLEIQMARGGRAWRGYFPVGAELTSGRPDQKEGLYFGEELSAEHPLVRAATPLHGPNLFPTAPAGFRECVLEYMAALTHVGHRVMAGVALSLDLDESYFADRYTRAPLTLFRIFNYPAQPDAALWGVGEHTDYGLLTILLQDDVGGLEVRSRSDWIAAPPVPNTFVCNIGDMLDRMTKGLYRSTPHRVHNRASCDRLSFPFFFDPNFFSRVQPIDVPRHVAAAGVATDRWDGQNIHAFEGTYGEYLLNKVRKVFPQLQQSALGGQRYTGAKT
jgi:isopenicillin N synthase-like dioxygenase